jgi:peptide/nickel transport system substrate-binding protein
VSALVLLTSAIVLAVAAPGPAVAAGPDGQLIWAVHVSLAPTYFEPAETPGLIPSGFEFHWAPPLHPYDPGKAKQLLVEAGYPNGFDGGTISSDLVYAPVAEAVGNYLGAVGIRVKLTPMERAAFSKAQSEKKLKNLTLGGSAAFGNAATRIEAFVVGGGFYAYGSYSDIDGLFQEQAAETDRKRREALLHRIQQLMHEKAMFLPVMEPAFLNGYGPRVAESGLGLITGHAYSAPYEDLRLKRP